jgi:ABC-type branched-subunit amino acid transport system substrate-binding protein
LYGNEYTRSKEVLDDYSKEIDGIIFAEANFDENREETKSLLNKLEENNIDLSFPSYQTKVYDSVYIIKDAIENCGTDQDTGCIKDYLYSIENREGIDGSLTINKYGDAELEFVLKQVKNGEVVVYNN